MVNIGLYPDWDVKLGAPDCSHCLAVAGPQVRTRTRLEQAEANKKWYLMVIWFSMGQTEILRCGHL